MDKPKNSPEVAPRLSKAPRFITCENAWIHGLTPELFRSMCASGMPHWTDGKDIVACLEDAKDWVRGATPSLKAVPS